MMSYDEACQAHAEDQGLSEPLEHLRKVFPPGSPYEVSLDQTGGFVMLIRVNETETNETGPYVWISAEAGQHEGEFCCGLYLTEEDDDPEYAFTSFAALPETVTHLLAKVASR